MAYSEIFETGDGVTTDYDVTFEYLDQSHVYVAVDKVLTTSIGSNYKFEWIDSTTIRVRTVVDEDPVPNGVEIRIFRQTPIDNPAVVFGGGASLSSANLNKNSEYLTFALQEATDDNEAFTKVYLGAFGEGPTTDNDGQAVQTGALYFDTTAQSLFYWNGTEWIAVDDATEATLTALESTEAARDEALAAKTEAETAQTNAETAQTGAETAKLGAETAKSGAEAAQAAAETALDDFTDIYLGAFASEPGTDNDGDPLTEGDLFFDTAVGRLKVWDGTEWAGLGGGGGLFRGENGEVGNPLTGAGDIFRVNEQTLNTDVTIDADENANATGPLAVASGVTLTVTSGGNLSIV